MHERTVVGLHIYPIKSLRGFPVTTAGLHRMGFRLDRRWMLVDEHGGFLTQREHPRMALVSVEEHGGSLRMLGPSGEEHAIPIDTPPTRLVPVSVWNNRLDAFAHGSETDAFFSDILGQRCRLVRIPEAAVRAVNPAYGSRGDHVSFADAYPVLITTTASLKDLNARMPHPVPMDRFRPNIVVSTETPFEEDAWTRIRVGGIELRIVKPCDRCAIVTTDQLTGERSEEPLRTLATFRKRGNSVYFGMNTIPDEEGTVHVGDPVEVLA